MKKEIWLPSTQTKVTVSMDGTVRIWDEITMNLRPIKEQTGFSQFTGKTEKEKEIDEIFN